MIGLAVFLSITTLTFIEHNRQSTRATITHFDNVLAQSAAQSVVEYALLNVTSYPNWRTNGWVKINNIMGTDADFRVTSETGSRFLLDVVVRTDTTEHLVSAIYDFATEPTEEQFPNINAAFGFAGSQGILSKSSSGKIIIDGRDEYSGWSETDMHLHGISVLNDNSTPLMGTLAEEFNVSINGASPAISANNEQIPLPATVLEEIKARADQVLPGGTGTSYNNFYYGKSDPQIVYIDGNARFTPGEAVGSGILFVNGNFRIGGGEFRFNGIIIVNGSLIDFSASGTMLNVKGALLGGTEADGLRINVSDREVRIIYDSNQIDIAKSLVKPPEVIELVSWWESSRPRVKTN